MSADAIIEILAPGLQTTVQDLGRYGFGRSGVATSGALDPFALRAGNLLVGNSENAAGLETMLLGLRFRALCDMTVAVTGADLQPFSDGRPLPLWKTLALQKGQEVSFKGPRSGFRAYLCVGGGLRVKEVLGSLATNLPAGFGGYEGRGVQAGDLLEGNKPESYLVNSSRQMAAEDIPVYSEEWSLRVIPGPQDGHFSDRGLRSLLETEYTASAQSDRTGIRLTGDFIESRSGVAESIISEGVIPGAIQVPSDGQPIIILNETVTGGYRKIAAVIGADLPLLGQIKPGDRVRFKTASLEMADEASRGVEAIFRRLHDLTTG